MGYKNNFRLLFSIVVFAVLQVILPFFTLWEATGSTYKLIISTLLAGSVLIPYIIISRKIKPITRLRYLLVILSIALLFHILYFYSNVGYWISSENSRITQAIQAILLDNFMHLCLYSYAIVTIIVMIRDKKDKK
ncbi:hypothetical protein RI065_00725 [Mycoplasmatota bacterium zrk1]